MFATKGLLREQSWTAVIGIPALIALGASAVVFGSESSVLALTVAVVAPLAIVFAPYAAADAKVADEAISPAEWRLTISSPLAPDSAFAKLRRADVGGRRVVESDPVRRTLVLTSRPSTWNYGFDFPVSVRASGSGSVIEIGIDPKTVPHDLAVEMNLKACAGDIENALAH